MKFCWSTLMVKDMEKSLAFYTEIVGLRVRNRFQPGPGMEIVFLGDGETAVELICSAAHRDVAVGPDISWGFEVDSLEQTHSLLREKGIEIESGPTQPNPHTRFFFVRDPNGLRIQFVENLK